MPFVSNGRCGPGVFVEDVRIGRGEVSARNRSGDSLGCPSGDWLFEEPPKSGPRLLVLLELQERDQLLPDESFIKPAVLTEGDPFDVDPILGPAREGLEDDEIFGAAGQQRDAFGNEEGRGATHRPLLEWHGPESHVEGDPVSAKQKKDAMSQRELVGIGDAGRKGRQELIRVFGFLSEPADDGEVNILREARLTPA
jgi:hypothetical protein